MLPFQIASFPDDRVELHPREAGLERILAADVIGAKATRGLLAPQVFFVDMVDAGSRIKPHFHGVDQFQLVLRGDGFLGKEPVQPGSFHYADAFQPYGPIEAGDQGLAYLTVRARHDTGVHYMPGSGHLRGGRPRRAQFVCTVPLGRRESCTIAGPYDDGLAATRIEIAADSSHALEASPDLGGVIGIVLDGAVIHRGQAYGEWSCFALSPGDSDELQGGGTGADLLAFHFPFPEVAPTAT